MAMNATMTIRLDNELKKQAEYICAEMGLTMSSAVTIFIKRLVKERAIPFRVAADDEFYSENNLRHLRDAARRMDEGKYVIHDIVEDEE